MWSATQIAQLLVDLEVEHPSLYFQLFENPFNYKVKEKLKDYLQTENIKPVLHIIYEAGKGEELKRIKSDYLLN